MLRLLPTCGRIPPDRRFIHEDDLINVAARTAIEALNDMLMLIAWVLGSAHEQVAFCMDHQIRRNCPFWRR